MIGTKAGRCSVIGLRPEEIEWVRVLVTLLRHPDPLAPELARQALAYVQSVASGEVQERRSNG